MSASVNDDLPPASSLPTAQTAPQKVKVPDGNYKGFVAGVFSGIAKLSGTSSSIENISSTNRQGLLDRPRGSQVSTCVRAVLEVD